MANKSTSELVAWLNHQHLLHSVMDKPGDDIACNIMWGREDADKAKQSAERLTEYQNKIDEVRGKILEEVACWIETNEIWLSVGGGGVSVKPTTRENVGSEYRALADAIRRLQSIPETHTLTLEQLPPQSHPMEECSNCKVNILATDYINQSALCKGCYDELVDYENQQNQGNR